MRATAAVFFASLVVLGWNAGEPGIATAYVDPVARIHAQDEAVYAASSLDMARHGEWITPRFLGRLALYKPPLFYWLSAGSVRMLGMNRLALRLPSIVAGAGTVAVVFATLRAMTSLNVAMLAALLLISNHLFFVLSRTGLMDALLVFEITTALCVVLRDPRLDGSRSRWIFGIATGAAVMTKALAGLLPVVILMCCGVSLIRLAQVCGIAAAVALPWHAWQMYAHPRWFWAEYVMSEHVTWGWMAPAQTTNESQIGFYAKRIAALDPVLLIAAGFAMFRERSRVLLAWIAVVIVGALAWRYRNAAYLAPMIPAMAIAAARAIPKQWREKPHRLKSVPRWPRVQAVAIVLGVVLFGLKWGFAALPFGLPFGAESNIASESALDEYASRHRGNALIVIEPDDQFYSAELDLPRTQYLWVDPSSKRTRLPLDFEYLGVTVTASDFANINALRPAFTQRLREWNMHSDEPIATVILARSAAEVATLIEAHPEADFFAPADARSASHDRQDAGARVFLLSRVVIQRP